ncbi:exosortase J [Tunturiibacter empetritectus]|uniref:Exosortase J n=1 Tax=Tunturiibacter lichenicola TaxID=2051959 RepID=A0A852V4U8_9BACT|nr:exosortase J [Edaphobacter lichenicola]NYF88068.1 exosortase J [Edaphobacter lichenicola]
MSSLPATAEVSPLRSAGAAGLSLPRAAGFAAIVSVFGLFTIFSTVTALWNLWTTDALKSIGMFIPLVSFVLVLRAWQSLGWEMEGSWWGLAVLVVTAAVVHIRDQAVLVFVFSPKWSIYVPPHSLVAFAYGAGVVLLFGGKRLFRASLFPLILLWFVNPIPHIFNVFVDLPLQRASAHVARAFAIALGQPLSPDQLRLMFTPEFGMFIAPGCNGIRGAVTMGFIALIAGYVYRFRWYAHAAVVAGAILLGYVFNFARLCILVLYYIVALHIPSLRSKAEMGDYVIGACLFLLGTFLLFHVVRRLSESPGQIKPPALTPACSAGAVAGRPFYLRFAGMLALVLVSGYGVARAYVSTYSGTAAAQRKADQNAPGQFPDRIGSYTLARTWNENLFAGPLIYHWAEYAPADGGAHVSIGISPVMGSHDTLICHSARGEDPIWRDQLSIPTANGQIGFSGSFFNDGATQYLEATTLCNSGSCGEYSSDRTHFGFVYSKPTTQSLLSQEAQRPIPILLKVETIDTTMPVEVARRQLTTDLQSFLGSANLDGLTKPYRQ